MQSGDWSSDVCSSDLGECYLPSPDICELPDSRSHGVAGGPPGLPRLITGPRVSQGGQVSRQTGPLGSHCPELSLPATTQPSCSVGRAQAWQTAESWVWKPVSQNTAGPEVMPQGGDKPEPRGSTCCPGAHRAVLGLALRRVRPPRLLGGPCLSNRHDDVLGKCGRVCGFKAHAQPSLPSASRVSSWRGCPMTTGGGLWVCRRCLGPATAGARIRDAGCRQGARNWGPPGVRREHWVRRCEGVSALGMRASDGGTRLGDPVRWPPATGVQMGLPAVS